MPPLSVHLQQDTRRFGREFLEVHQYMDRGWETMGVRHRAIGHDQETVEEVRQRWGDEAAEAARWHIRDDYTLSLAPFSRWGRITSQTAITRPP